jgi:hypothetical protein
MCIMGNTSFVNAEDIPLYTKMQDDLTELKADFNAAADKVRLVFLPSPT